MESLFLFDGSHSYVAAYTQVGVFISTGSSVLVGDSTDTLLVLCLYFIRVLNQYTLLVLYQYFDTSLALVLLLLEHFVIT